MNSLSVGGYHHQNAGKLAKQAANSKQRPLANDYSRKVGGPVKARHPSNSLNQSNSDLYNNNNQVYGHQTHNYQSKYSNNAHPSTNKYNYNETGLNNISSSSNSSITVKSLEKQKKKIFTIIEQMAKAKQQINYDYPGVAESHKYTLIRAVDALINDLNNEVVSISDDISRAKQGLGLNIDSKRTKRKVRRLDDQSNELLQRIQEFTLDYPDMNQNSRTNLKTNNYLSNDIDSNTNNQRATSSVLRKQVPLEKVQNDFRSMSRPRGETITNNHVYQDPSYHQTSIQDHNALGKSDYLEKLNGNSNIYHQDQTTNIFNNYQPNTSTNVQSNILQQKQQHMIKSKSDLSKKRALGAPRYQNIFNQQQDETWQKLQDLINIGQDKTVSLNNLTINAANSNQIGEVTEFDRTPMRIDKQADRRGNNTDLGNTYNQSTSQQVRIKDLLQQQQQSNNSNMISLNATTNNKEIEDIRNQIKEVMLMTKESTQQTQIKMQTLEKQSSHLETKLTLVQKEQSQIISNYQQLENRYKDIIKENQHIKNELLDLRKNRQIINKVTPDQSFNMPLNKSNVNETVSAGRHANLENEFFTPNKARDTDRTMKRDHHNISESRRLGSNTNILDSLAYNSNNTNTVMSQEKSAQLQDVQARNKQEQRRIAAKTNLHNNSNMYYGIGGGGKKNDSNYYDVGLKSERMIENFKNFQNKQTYKNHYL
eukprot:403339891